MRRTLTKVLVVLTITTIGALAADNSLGNWKLNVEKSKSTQAPFPLKSLTVIREASDGGVKVTITGEQSDGTPVNASYTAKYDGTATTVTGSGTPYDTISVKQSNANTLTDERQKTGTTYRAKGRTVISNGGKNMTLMVKGTDANGKPLASTLVFEKQ